MPSGHDSAVVCYGSYISLHALDPRTYYVSVSVMERQSQCVQTAYLYMPAHTHTSCQLNWTRPRATHTNIFIGTKITKAILNYLHAYYLRIQRLKCTFVILPVVLYGYGVCSDTVGE